MGAGAENAGEVAVPEPIRCERCLTPIQGEPHMMATRRFCCASCAVGSACEHQGVRRGDAIRRYDGNFDRFRQVVRHSGPYERERTTGSG